MFQRLRRLFRSTKARSRQPRSLQVENMEQRIVFSTTAFASTDPAPSLYKQAWALPAPSGTIVKVSTEAGLQSAVRNAQPNSTILIAPGTYQLSNTLHLENVANVSIRGASGKRDDVVLVGRGMTNANYGDVPHGFLLSNAQDVLIADLTIKNVWYHSISLNAGTERPVLHNLRLVDAGEQFIKANPDDAGGGVDGGIVRFSRIEYTNTAPTYYTNGVDVHTGAGWTIRDNVFRNIRGPAGQLAGPAVLVWNGSRNTVTSGNFFLNVDRAIHYGLLGDRLNDHQGGSIRNNFIYRAGSQAGDLGIGIFNSPNTQVVHNTIVLNGSYSNAIEYRFGGTTGTVIANNLTDAAILRRDGALGTLTGNITTARPWWFVNAGIGDLHLAATAPAINAALSAATQVDYDGQARASGAVADVGADEVGIVLNQAPALTGISGSTGYRRGSSAIQLAAWASVKDVDSKNFAGGALLVRFTSGGHSANRLEIRGGVFTRSGENVIYNGRVIGKVTSDGIGLNQLRIAFTSNATPWIAQQLTRSIYFRTYGSTTTATRTVAFSLTDGDGGTSAIRTRLVNIS